MSKTTRRGFLGFLIAITAAKKIPEVRSLSTEMAIERPLMEPRLSPWEIVERYKIKKRKAEFGVAAAKPKDSTATS